jgi:hypothetical protein
MLLLTGCGAKEPVAESASAVTLRFVPKEDKDVSTPSLVAAQQFADAVDGWTQEAHAKLINNKLDYDKPFAGLYRSRLIEYQNGVSSMHPATAAGYAIEEYVTEKAKSVSGVKAQAIVAGMRGTRPDLVYELTDRTLALIDITSTKQAGHILLKKGNWTKDKINVSYVAEVLYPSLDFNDLAGSSKFDQNLVDDVLRERAARAAEIEKNKEAEEQELADIWEAAQENLVSQFGPLDVGFFERMKSGLKLTQRTATGRLEMVGIDIDKSMTSSYKEWKTAYLEKQNQLDRPAIWKVIRKMALMDFGATQ